MKRVLIIEDEEIMLKLLKRKLSQDYEVFTATDGQQGLDMIKRAAPDLILLDLVMPKMDGFGVMEEITKDENLKKIPLVVISNSGQPVEMDKIKEMGARDWLIKTEFDPQELSDKVKKIIGT